MPSKRAKLSHPSPEDARASSEEEVAPHDEIVDSVDEDGKDAEEEVIEEVEVEDDDEQQEMGDQEDYAIGEKRKTEAEDADIEEEEEEDVEEDEEESQREVPDEEEEEIVEVEVEVEEEEDIERGDLEEEEVDAEYDEGDEADEIENAGEHDVDSGDEDAASVEEDAEDADGAAHDAEEDDEADEDAHDADEEVYDTDEDAQEVVEDVDDADEDNDGESREQLATEDDDDEDGDAEDDDDDDGDEYDNEPREELVTKNGTGDDEEDAEDERRKRLAILMCFTSLQCLMATELCRDTTPPYDEIGFEESTSLPAAFLKLVLLAVTGLMQEEGRQCWKHQRPGQEWNQIERGVSSTDAGTRDSIWRRKYSMSYACFLYLVEELRPFVQSESQMYVRAPLEIERAVAMVLYRFAHGLSAREVAEKYNVGASTVGKYTSIIASALAEANKLYGRYVAIPTGDRMARVISQFQQTTNVSQMCGAIDGTHIKLCFKPDKWYNSPTHDSTQKSTSILLQAVCDAKKLFWDICCIAPGTGHEATHFIASNVYQNIKEGLSLQEPVLALEGKEVTPYMVGDSAYPSRSFLLKPFDTDDPLRKAFDEQLRKGFACIEGAFGILKTRWKILKGMNVHLTQAPRIAIACCVLHNICQLWREPEPPQQHPQAHSIEQTHGVATSYEIDEAAKLAGEAVREALFRDWVKRSLENPCASLDQENIFSGQN